MKKRIAFFGEPWHGSMQRFDAFMRSNPQYEYSFINANKSMNQNYFDSGQIHPFELVPSHPFESKFFYDFNPSEYDVILTLNDKFFDKVLAAYGSSCPNLVDKNILEQANKDFGFKVIQSSDFEDNQMVFVKPRIGAGQYAIDDLSYKKFRYGEIKDRLNLSIHKVQEFLPSPLFTFVSTLVDHGGNIEFMDVTQAYHLFDYKDVSLNCLLESKSNQVEKFAEQISLAKEFIKFVKLDTIPGIYMCQFTTDFLNIIDFNVRSGPIADYVTFNDLYTHKIHNNFSFIVEDRPVNQELRYPRYRCYLEDMNGTIICPLVQKPDFVNRRLLYENKTSGLIRSDYHTYLEILNL